MKNVPEKEVVIVFNNGRGGAGKDTQVEFALAALAKRKIEAASFSTGEELRKINANPEDPLHPLFVEQKQIQDQGGLVSDTPINKLFRDRTNSLLRGGKQWIGITGYPRTEAQLAHADKYIERVNKWTRFRIKEIQVFHEIPESVSFKRAAARRKQALEINETPRRDDLPEVVERRNREYTQVANVRDQLLKEVANGCRKNVRVVDSDAPIEDVTKRYFEAIGL